MAMLHFSNERSAIFKCPPHCKTCILCASSWQRLCRTFGSPSQTQAPPHSYAFFEETETLVCIVSQIFILNLNPFITSAFNCFCIKHPSRVSDLMSSSIDPHVTCMPSNLLPTDRCALSYLILCSFIRHFPNVCSYLRSSTCASACVLFSFRRVEVGGALTS